VADVPFYQRKGLQIIVALAGAIGMTALWTALGPQLVPLFDEWLDALGPFAAPGFAVGSGIALALCAPASLLYVAGGTIFGLVDGVLLGTAAAVLGTCLAFAIARTTFGARAARAIARNARLERFEQALSERGLWLVVLLRLSVLFPIGPVSYALGVMRIPVRHFMLALPAVVPSVVLYTYAGHLARGLWSGARAREAWEWSVLGLGFAATALVTVWIGRAATRALDRRASVPARCA
jgi:uncharacterized membrane protein YdjX (TVP38/TMEM64 family)